MAIINEKLAAIKTAKNDIEIAILEKGGEITEGDTISDYGDIIRTLQPQFVPGNGIIIDSSVISVDSSTVQDLTQIEIVDKTSDAGTSFAIDPNKMYMFGTRTALTITLNAGTSGIVNEYMFQFTSGSTATTLNVPSSVVWIKDPDIQTSKKYAVSIENNMGIIGEWDNA